MAARGGCRTTTTQDIHIPSAGRGGLGSSSQAPTGSICIEYKDEDDGEVDQRHEELGPSQLQDTPRLSLHSLQALGDAVHLTLTIQAMTRLVTRVRVRLRLGGSEGLW